MNTLPPAIPAGPLSHALWAMGAVALYAAIQHSALALRGGERTLHLSFATMALAVAVNLPVSAYAYQAVSIPVLVLAIKVMNTSAGVFGLGFLWFLPAYAGHEPRGFKIPTGAFLLFLMALVWLRPEGLLFDRVDAIVPDRTPWGEYLAVASGGYSVWSRIYALPFLAILGVGFYLALRLERGGWKQRGRWLALALALLLAGLLLTTWHDIHGERGKLRGTEIGFMGIIVLMSGQLAAEAAEAQGARALLRRMAAETALAGERERRRLAAGLHDSPLQKIALARMQLQRHAETPLAEQSLSLLAEAMEELRDAIFELSPALLYNVGLDAALAQLGRDAAARSGFEVRFVGEETTPKLDETRRVTLYQGARELVVNALKHSGGRALLIERLNRPGAVAVRVSDDGAGFDPRALRRQQWDARHFGLLGLEESLPSLGGGIDIASGPEGTRVMLWLPKGEESA